MKIRRAWAAFPLILLALLAASPAGAAVAVHFYSKDLASTYPHAFVALDGTLEPSGQRVKANFGFTAKTVTPSVLQGAVAGYVQRLQPAYIAQSERHFTVMVDAAGYARIMRRIAAWQARAQPSYQLDRRNCVHFVMELAAAAGLKINRHSQYFKQPRSFLQELRALNAGVK